jgi:hypothetical protein
MDFHTTFSQPARELMEESPSIDWDIEVETFYGSWSKEVLLLVLKLRSFGLSIQWVFPTVHISSIG